MWIQWRTTTRCINGKLEIRVLEFPTEGRPHIGQYLPNIETGAMYTVSMMLNSIRIVFTSNEPEVVVYEDSDVYVNIYYAGSIRRLTIQLKHPDAVAILSEPKLEYSSSPTRYIKPNYYSELIKCQYYLRYIPITASARIPATQIFNAEQIRFLFDYDMYRSPDYIDWDILQISMPNEDLTSNNTYQISNIHVLVNFPGSILIIVTIDGTLNIAQVSNGIARLEASSETFKKPLLSAEILPF